MASAPMPITATVAAIPLQVRFPSFIASPFFLDWAQSLFDRRAAATDHSVDPIAYKNFPERR